MKKWILRLAIPIFVIACNSNTSDRDPVDPQKLTFTQHIAPILYKNCVVCHRDQGIAPFSLITYREVWRKKKTIVEVTGKGIMPPWPANPQYSHFVGERILSSLEKNRLKNWVKFGAKKGPDSAFPKAPIFPNGSLLGKPDLVLYLDSIYLEAHGRDKFFTVKIPALLEHDTFVRAVEFVPGKGQYVHHMNGHLLNYQDGLKINVHDGKRIADMESSSSDLEVKALNLWHDDGSVPLRIHSAVNYLPGVYPTVYPLGIGGFKMNKKSAFVASDIHYGPSHDNHFDRSHINVFFAKSPPERPTYELMLGTNGQSDIIPPLVIPPNRIFKCHTKGEVPEDISVLTINPHMHLLGKSFTAFGLTPKGDTIKLIQIKQWDFRWQYFYTFLHPVKLPKGTLIIVEGVYDNTENNPNNPNSPPRTVSDKNATMKTSDEMFQCIITWMPYRKGDEKISLKNLE